MSYKNNKKTKTNRTCFVQTQWMFLFPQDYLQNIFIKWFKLGLQMVTDDTLWTPAKTKSFNSAIWGSALPFCFPSHTGAGQISLWEPKLFRHMRNNLLHGHSELNQTTASKCLQEIHTHMNLWLSPTVDEPLENVSSIRTIQYSTHSGAEWRRDTKTKREEKELPQNFGPCAFKQVMSYRHATAGYVAFVVVWLFSSLAKVSGLGQDLQHLSSDVRCYSVDLSQTKIMFPLKRPKGGCRRPRAWF